MHTQLVFLNLLYHIHWLIFSDSVLFVITMYRRCILCMCLCVVIIQLFRLPYLNKRIVSYRLVRRERRWTEDIVESVGLKISEGV